MKFTEWIKKSGKKIIVTDRVKNGTRLLRKSNREQGVDTCEASCKTLLQIAEELWVANQAFDGAGEVAQLIGAEAGVYIIDEILRKKQDSFVPKECYCITTSEELMRNINQIRMNETTDAYASANEQKLLEIKDMIAEYEAVLKEKGCVDEAMVLKSALQALKECTEKELLLYLPWLKGCSIGVLEDMEFSALEKAFFEKLLETAGYDAECLEFCSRDDTGKNVSYEFFGAYGVANEVRYVGKQIVEKKLPYGAVNLFYTDAVYENFIKGIFEKTGIPYTFLTGEKIAGSDTVQLMVSILDWAESDYLYEKLKRIVENPLLTFKNVEAGEEAEEGLRSPMTCYNHFLRKGIGWGKERYLECVKRVGKDEKEREKYKYFRSFLRELIEIFEVNESCEMLYTRLFDFTMKYTYSQSEERKKLKAVLEEQKLVFAQVAAQESPQEMLHLVRERLLGLKINGENNNSKVNVYKVQNVEVLERPYNFVIGLSAKQFAADTTESPVLSDIELRQYLRGNVQLAAEAGSHLRENLSRTLNTLTNGSVSMGYTTYDTVELKESSPSVFYLDYKDRMGASEETDDYYGYEFLTDAINIPCNVQNTQSEVTDKASIGMSSSGLQTLSECPLRYYYHYIKMLPSIEFQEKKAHQWLTPAAKGNLFHRTMERYCNEVIKLSQEVCEEVDAAVFERLFEAAVVEMLEELPYVSETVFKQEKEAERTIIWNYLVQFQKALYADAQAGICWKILGCELEFKEVSYEVTDPDGSGKVFEVLFNGSIDRLDAYLKDAVLYLRIVDYKTGDFKKKEKEIKNNKQLQHFVYAMAATEYVKKHKAELETLFGEDIHEVQLSNMQYLFPKDGVLDATNKVSAAVRAGEYRLPQQIDDMIWGLLGNLYCVDEKLAQDYMTDFAMGQETSSKGNKKKNDACTYCKYVRQCRRKLGMEL